MSFHVSNLGSFGSGLPTDIDGYVPAADDGPFSLNYDHGTGDTHDSDGELTEYGEWWVEDRWPEIKAAAIAATEAAEAAISHWQEKR